MKEQLIECVPNFSEGNDAGVIDQITAQIESVDAVTLLDVVVVGDGSVNRANSRREDTE